MTISIIAAMTKDRVIGKDNKLLWNLPEEMKHFRETTRDSVVIMGRKTFESIGRPLPNRINIVVSRSAQEIAGVIFCTGLEEALEKAKIYGKAIFIIGGAQIYAQAMEYADRLIISIVDDEYEGDALFPKIDEPAWKEEKREQRRGFEVVMYGRT